MLPSTLRTRLAPLARQAPLFRSTVSQVQTRDVSTQERPVSPHMMIYAWPLAALSSVTHRATGVILCIGLYGMGIGAVAGVDVASTMATIGASSVGPLAKFSVAFPLTYHYMGGLRHMYWEVKPEGLSPETQKQSSIALYAASGVISAGLMFV